MDLFQTLTMDQILFAIIATGMLREVMILTLPDAVAGPDGWLIKTADDE